MNEYGWLYVLARGQGSDLVNVTRTLALAVLIAPWQDWSYARVACVHTYVLGYLGLKLHTYQPGKTGLSQYFAYVHI